MYRMWHDICVFNWPLYLNCRAALRPTGGNTELSGKFTIVCAENGKTSE